MEDIHEADLNYFLCDIYCYSSLIAGAAAAWIWYGITKPYQTSQGGVFVRCSRIGAS